jgi:parvulin-like peptidyl-prolyl isomerase
MSESFNKFRQQLSSTFEGKKRWSAKSITAMVLFGCIILVFILFGFPSRLSQHAGAMGAAAQVNNTLIPISDLRSESSRMEQMYAPLFGGAGMGDAQRQFVVQQALETLINQELISQLAKKEGILATDAEIQDFIVREIPAFQKDGRFQRDLYFGVLEANHLNPADFEAKLRKEKSGVRTQRLFQAVEQPLSFELQKLKNLQENKLNVFFAKVSKEQVLKSMPVSLSDASGKLADANFAKKVQDYYDANKAEFVVSPEVHAQHILIKIDDKRDQNAAKQKIDEIKAQSKNKDFGQLAKEFSEDPGSKDKNGDLGTFSKGKMVPEFETTAFNQKVGEISDPVRTPYGYHLIKVLDRKDGGQRSFDQAKNEIAQKLIATENYDSNLKILEEALAKSDSAAIDATLKKMGVNWEETGFFDLSQDMVPKLGSPEASKAAFQLSDNKKIYPQLVRDGGERFVLKLKESKKDATLPVDKLTEQMAQERASDLFRAWVESAKKTAKIERNMEALAGNR